MTIAYIPLTQGQSALVDAEDYRKISKHTWHAQRHNNNKGYYAARFDLTVPKKTKIYLHREIMAAPPGSYVDHKDGNGLNNTRANLRLVTSSENQMNRRKGKGTSKYKGVSWDTRRKQWDAQIQSNKKKQRIGRFVTEEEAATAYDIAATRLYGQYAKLNKAA